MRRGPASAFLALVAPACGSGEPSIGEEAESEAEAEAEAEAEGEGDKSACGDGVCAPDEVPGCPCDCEDGGTCKYPVPACRDDKGREIDCALVLFACLAVDCGWLPECKKPDGGGIGNPGWCCLDAEATMDRALDYCGKICTPIDGGVPAPDAGVLPDAGAYSWCAEAMICVDGAAVAVQDYPTFPCEACATLGEHVLAAGRECR